MSVVITTGPRNGSVANRLEIHDFVKNEKFFSLYVQALRQMQDKPQDGAQSFFQVSGIHGYPFVPWDGVQGQVAVGPRGTSGGYCTHNNVLFPTWHRPYVALFEQVVQKLAATLAATYEVDTPGWMQAARNLRQPFWDWAKYPLPPDEVISLQQVSITGPKGTKIVVNNPLYTYTFNPVDPSFPSPYNVWKTTLRYPTAQATDNVDALKERLTATNQDVVYKTYNMLTRTTNWFDFSNTLPSDRQTSNSIEAIHDGVHFNLGGPAAGIKDATGHMANVAMAAFDPIFYLHHCNVDRLLSLWSALNPGVWVSPNTSYDGTFTIASEVPIDQNTPLTPFRNSGSTFWPSSAIKDTATFGYTYPDFNGLNAQNPQALRQAIGTQINQLYGSPIFGGASASGGSSGPASALPVGGSSVSASAPVVPRSLVQAIAKTPTASPHGCPHLGVYDWTARVQFKKYEVGQSFCVTLFFGAVPEDPKQWLTCNNSAGAHYAFVNSHPETCANCVSSGDIVIEGFVHLNLALAHLSGLGSLDPEVVEPYLKKELHWRAQKADGEPVDLRSLEVTVFSTPLTYPSGTLFPVGGESRRCSHITHGRPGGCRQL